MRQVIISDTSCLILLYKIGELNLLQKLYATVIVTQTVANEFGEPLPEFIVVKNPADKRQQTILEISLDKGEASSIALALENENAVLIIDEQKGRKVAKRLGINITGTAGVLAQAKLKGHVHLLRPIFERIKETDFRLSEDFIEATLKQVGE